MKQSNRVEEHARHRNRHPPISMSGNRPLQPQPQPQSSQPPRLMVPQRSMPDMNARRGNPVPPGYVPVKSTTFCAHVPLGVTVDGYKNTGYLPLYLQKPAEIPRSRSAAVLGEKKEKSWMKRGFAALKGKFGKKKEAEKQEKQVLPKRDRKPVPIPPTRSSFHLDLPWDSLYPANNAFREQRRARLAREEEEEEEEGMREGSGVERMAGLPPRALTPYHLDQYRPENRTSTPGGRPAYRYVRREEVGVVASPAPATFAGSPVAGRETEEVGKEREKARRVLVGEEGEL